MDGIHVITHDRCTEYVGHFEEPFSEIVQTVVKQQRLASTQTSLNAG